MSNINIEIEMETVKPDWNVLDSTSTSYIANKTHYADVFATCQSGQQMYINVPEEFVGDINACRIRYNDTLYRLPDTVGVDVYYPNENDWVVSFRLNKNQSDGTFRDIELYCRSSVIDDTSFFEFLTTGFNYRCLDSFYLPKDVVYEDKLKTINGNSILGSGDIAINNACIASFTIGELIKSKVVTITRDFLDAAYHNPQILIPVREDRTQQIYYSTSQVEIMNPQEGTYIILNIMYDPYNHYQAIISNKIL